MNLIKPSISSDYRLHCDTEVSRAEVNTQQYYIWLGVCEICPI